MSKFYIPLVDPLQYDWGVISMDLFLSSTPRNVFRAVVRAIRACLHMSGSIFS